MAALDFLQAQPLTFSKRKIKSAFDKVAARA